MITVQWRVTYVVGIEVSTRTTTITIFSVTGNNYGEVFAKFLDELNCLSGKSLTIDMLGCEVKEETPAPVFVH